MNATVLVNPLLVWGLATFHTTFFVLAAVFLLYQGGDLGKVLAGVGTPIGFGIFLLLWLATWWSTRQLVRSLAARRLTYPKGMTAFLFYGLFWGDVNGVIFLLSLLPGVFVYVVFSSIGEGKPVPIIVLVMAGPSFGLIASLVAAVVGAIIGLLFGVVDAVVLLAVQALLPAPSDGVDAGNAEEA